MSLQSFYLCMYSAYSCVLSVCRPIGHVPYAVVMLLHFYLKMSEELQLLLKHNLQL